MTPGFLPISLAGALLLLAAAVLFAGIRIGRRATQPVQAPRPAVRLFSHGDCIDYVDRREKGQPLVLRRCLADLIAYAFEDDAPAYGEDWGPWLERNYERLRAVAIEEVSRGEYLNATKGGS